MADVILSSPGVWRAQREGPLLGNPVLHLLELYLTFVDHWSLCNEWAFGQVVSCW